MRVGYQDIKEYYVISFDKNEIPKGVIAGPFDTEEQAFGAVSSLESFYPELRLSVTGGTLQFVPR